jgi:hypothetical protein
MFLAAKNVRSPSFTESPFIRYHPFVLVHNVRLYSECNTKDKGGKNACENSIPPTNIQYLKVHYVIENDRILHNHTQYSIQY